MALVHLARRVGAAPHVRLGTGPQPRFPEGRVGQDNHVRGEARPVARTTATWGPARILQSGQAPGAEAFSFLAADDAALAAVAYKPKQVVVRQGDPADAVFYIQEGRIQLMVVSEEGKEGIIAMLGAGEFFGERCLAGQRMHIASAIATVASKVVRIEREIMTRALREQPNFSTAFMVFLLSRTAQIEADLVDQLFNSSERRLARVLLLLANFDGERKTETTISKVNQETLAARVGTTRSRVNKFMNKFRRLGFIDYDHEPSGGVRVHASLLNAAGLADPSPRVAGRPGSGCPGHA